MSFESPKTLPGIWSEVIDSGRLKTRVLYTAPTQDPGAPAFGDGGKTRKSWRPTLLEVLRMRNDRRTSFRRSLSERRRTSMRFGVSPEAFPTSPRANQSPPNSARDAARSVSLGCETILFLHGNVSSATFWEETMLDAAEQGYQCIAYDQRGFGDADPATTIDATHGLRDLSDDLAALLRYLGLDPCPEAAELDGDALHRAMAKKLTAHNTDDERELLQNVDASQLSAATSRDRRTGVHVVGHSAGGTIALQFASDYPHLCATLTLVNPGSPFGFGGCHGPDGEPNAPDFSGSGGGIVGPDFVEHLQEGCRDETNGHPRHVLRTLYFAPPFIADREESLLTSMFTTHIGDKDYPGDFVKCPAGTHWPGLLPGKHGLLNALSPKYATPKDTAVARLCRNNCRALSAVLTAYTVKEQEEKTASSPSTAAARRTSSVTTAASAIKVAMGGGLRHPLPILWIRGEVDVIVSDTSLCDFANLGKIGALPGWPGADLAPPQPMVLQTRSFLDAYDREMRRLHQNRVAVVSALRAAAQQTNNGVRDGASSPFAPSPRDSWHAPECVFVDSESEESSDDDGDLPPHLKAELEKKKTADGALSSSNASTPIVGRTPRESTIPNNAAAPNLLLPIYYREVVLPGVGHTPYIECPQVFNKLLFNFLGRGSIH